jgi:hypothetical protein
MGMSEEGSRKAFQEQKKQRFLADRFINGVSASTNFNLSVLPSRDADYTMVEVNGTTNIIRFRESSCNVYKAQPYSAVNKHTSEKAFDYSIEPLALDESNPGPIPYYSKYCSCSMPQPDSVNQDLFIEDIQPDEIGDLHDHVDLVTGTVVGKLPTSLKTLALYNWVKSFFPCENFIMDAFIHKEYEISDPSVMVYNLIDQPDNPLTERVTDRGEKYRFHFDEKLIQLSGGALSAQISEIPWYSEMVSDIFKTMGENDEDYNLFRVKIQYPYIPSMVVIVLMETESDSGKFQ